MKLFKNQSGFGLPVLILIAAIAIGAVGYMTYQANKKVNDQATNQSASTTKPQSQRETEYDPGITTAIKVYLNKMDASNSEIKETIDSGYSVMKEQGDFAVIYAGPKIGGAKYYLKKIASSWKVVWAGQNVAPMCLMDYGFPRSWHSDTATGYEDGCEKI